MHPIYEELENEIFKVTLSKELYEKEAVFAAIYKFSEEMVAKVEPQDITHINIYVARKKDGIDIKKVMDNFLLELVDQQLRLDIDRRTKGIRQKIYDEAFRPLQGR